MLLYSVTNAHHKCGHENDKKIIRQSHIETSALLDEDMLK